MMPPSDSAATSLPCHRYRSGHLTADKRLRYASPKLPSATSFIRKTLYAIAKPKVFKLQHLKYKEGLKWGR